MEPHVHSVIVRVQEHDGVDALLLLGVGAHFICGAVQIEPVLGLGEDRCAYFVPRMMVIGEGRRQSRNEISVVCDAIVSGLSMNSQSSPYE